MAVPALDARHLPAVHGAQLAIDTTLVSPLRADGEPHRRCSDEDGAASEGKRPTLANPVLANPFLANLFLDLVCIMVGPQRVWGQTRRKVGGGPEGWGAQNFALFFSVSRSHFRSFCLSLGVFSWNFGGV